MIKKVENYVRKLVSVELANEKGTYPSKISEKQIEVAIKNRKVGKYDIVTELRYYKDLATDRAKYQFEVALKDSEDNFFNDSLIDISDDEFEEYINEKTSQLSLLINNQLTLINMLSVTNPDDYKIASQQIDWLNKLLKELCNYWNPDDVVVQVEDNYLNDSFNLLDSISSRELTNKGVNSRLKENFNSINKVLCSIA